MTGPLEPDETQADRDLEVICGYMNNSLQPHERDEMRRRLNEEPEVYKLVSPIIFASYVEAERAYAPPDAAEMKDTWAQFERLAVSKYQTRRRRRRRMALTLLMMFGVLAFVLTVLW